MVPCTSLENNPRMNLINTFLLRIVFQKIYIQKPIYTQLNMSFNLLHVIKKINWGFQNKTVNPSTVYCQATTNSTWPSAAFKEAWAWPLWGTKLSVSQSPIRKADPCQLRLSPLVVQGILSMQRYGVSLYIYVFLGIAYCFDWYNEVDWNLFVMTYFCCCYILRF